jgi:quinoprotein glucose dehydrogenase
MAARKQPFVDNASKQEDPYFRLPYNCTGYNKFLTKEGYPAIMPPWGTLTAIDLNQSEDRLAGYAGRLSGTKGQGYSQRDRELWRVGGDGRVACCSSPLPATPNSGRLTSARVSCYGRRIFLPLVLQPRPSMKLDGKEYVVIACGGGKLHKKSGDTYVAFALP